MTTDSSPQRISRGLDVAPNVSPTVLGIVTSFLLLLVLLTPGWCQWRWPVDGSFSWNNDYASFNRVLDSSGAPNRKYHTGIDITTTIGWGDTIRATADGIIRPGWVYGLAGAPGGVKTEQTFWIWYDRDGDQKWDKGEEYSETVATQVTNHGLGMAIIIEHTGGVYSLYGHLDNIAKPIYDAVVREGRVYSVRKGEPIGLMGRSYYTQRYGNFGVHLHFEVKSTPLLSDALGSFWGYVPDLPTAYGYYDPVTFIEPPPQVENLQPQQAVKALLTSALREGPGQKYAVLGWVSEGQQFVARRIARISANEEWVEVYIPNARGKSYGWVARRWDGRDRLRFDPNAKIVRVVWDRVRLRADAGTDKQVLRVWNGKSADDVYAWNDSYFVSLETKFGSGSTRPWHKVCIPLIYRQNPSDTSIADEPTGGLSGRSDPSWKFTGDWGPYAWIAGDALEEVSSGTSIQMDVSPTSLPFGNVEVGSYNDQQVTISNRSTSTATLTGRVSISGTDFSVLESGDFSLEPGRSRVFTVRFAPTSATARSGTLRITHNATNPDRPVDVSLSGTGTDTTAPRISNVRIEPATLSSSGGAVAIRADVTDAAAVSSVWAEVRKPDGSTVTVPMSRESGNTFRGDYSAPANTSTMEQRYSVRISAKDPSNNVASTGWDYSFSVRGVAVYIDVSAVVLDFGSRAVGSYRDLSVTVTNRSTSTAKLTGDVTITGTDFSIASGGGNFELPPASSRTITVRFSPTDAVSRSGTLQIRHNATNQTSPILVSLSGVGAAPKIRVEPESLAFSTTAGNNPAAQSFDVRNVGTTTLNWQASKAGGASWFSFSPNSGSLGANGSQSITVSINAAGLGQGTYTDTIVVSDPNAINSPQRVQITLTVTAVARATIDVVPTSLVFHTAPGSNPGNQIFTIRNTGTATLVWNAAKQGGSSWFSFTPSSGTLNAGTSQSVTVSINAAGLGQGTYSDAITISDPNATNSPRSVSVTLKVTGARYYPVLNVENASGQIGQEVPLRAVLKRGSDGAPVTGRNVYFMVDGQLVGSALTDGQGVASFNWTVTDGELGHRPLVAHFSGDAEYEPVSGSATFRRYAETVLRTDDAEAYQGETVTIGAMLYYEDNQGNRHPIEGRTLRFYINGAHIGDSMTDAEGWALIDYSIPSDAGSGIIGVSFEGDEAYNPSYAEGRLIVHPYFVDTVVIVNNAEAYRGDTVTLRAVVLRADTWSSLVGVPVHFAVDGEYIGYAIADSWGAEISYQVRPDMEPGEHVIEAFFAGEGWFNPNYGQGTLRVYEKWQTFVEVFNSWGKQGDVVPVGARLVRANGAPIEGAWLEFFIDGELIGSGVTDAEGLVTGRYGIPPNSVPGEHPIEVFFDGNETHFASRGSGKLYVDPAQTRIFGYVELGDFAGDTSTVRVRVEIRPLGSNTPVDVHDTFLDAYGMFSIETWGRGEFDVAVKASHWLRQKHSYVWLWDEVWIPFSLVNGDIDGDNEVTLFDFGELVVAFGSMPGDSNWSQEADLDGDQEVTLFDFGILVRNFGLIGDE